jgi:hypothetical protein
MAMDIHVPAADLCNASEVRPLPIILHIDKAHYDLHGHLAVTPIGVTLGMWDLDTQQKTHAWRQMATVPNLSAKKGKKQEEENVQENSPGLCTRNKLNDNLKDPKNLLFNDFMIIRFRTGDKVMGTTVILVKMIVIIKLVIIDLCIDAIHDVKFLYNSQFVSVVKISFNGSNQFVQLFEIAFFQD